MEKKKLDTLRKKERRTHTEDIDANEKMDKQWKSCLFFSFQKKRLVLFLKENALRVDVTNKVKTFLPFFLFFFLPSNAFSSSLYTALVNVKWHFSFSPFSSHLKIDLMGQLNKKTKKKKEKKWK